MNEALTYCERHPGTETYITCGRCGVAICPQCMVHTPGGIRCPHCAQLRRPPMYEISLRDYLRAVPAALSAAIAIGFVGALLLPPRSNAGIFLLAIALIAGLGAGAGIAEAITRATNRKRGRAMQLVALGGVMVAGVLRLVFTGLDPALWVQDIVGGFALAVALVSAWGRLR
ncbi:MAG: hypothetical protein FJZ92_10030 [Chloroflexi bacterium]|nr:hypothetical protein [Chloroflexota bacterium]